MIEINNLTKTPVDKKLLTEVAKIVLKGENKGKGELSIALVGLGEIKKLNNKYRKKNRPTDVLSFNYVSGATLRGVRLRASSKFHASYRDLGEIVICPAVVRKNAKKYKTSFKKELARVLIHGILHILGYDHGKSKKEAIEMEKKQERYLSQFF